LAKPRFLASHQVDAEVPHPTLILEYVELIPQETANQQETLVVPIETISLTADPGPKAPTSLVTRTIHPSHGM